MEQLTLFDNRDMNSDIMSGKKNTKDLSKPWSPTKLKKEGRPLKVGEDVNYHSVIGGPVTSNNHSIYHIEHYQGIAWITNHGACVAIDALSRRKPCGVILVANSG